MDKTFARLQRFNHPAIFLDRKFKERVKKWGYHLSGTLIFKRLGIED